MLGSQPNLSSEDSVQICCQTLPPPTPTTLQHEAELVSNADLVPANHWQCSCPQQLQPPLTFQPATEPVSYANIVPANCLWRSSLQPNLYDRWSCYCLPVIRTTIVSVLIRFWPACQLDRLLFQTTSAWHRQTPLRLHGRYTSIHMSMNDDPILRGYVDIPSVNQRLNKPGCRSSCLCNWCVCIFDRLQLHLQPKYEFTSSTDSRFTCLRTCPYLQPTPATLTFYTDPIRSDFQHRMKCSNHDPTPYEQFVYYLPNNINNI